MNIEAYIASGMLENYALGLCTDAERLEVEGLLKAHPELQQELREIEQSLFEYGQQHAQSPSPQLKAKVLDRIQNNGSVHSNTTPVVQIRRFNWLAAASIALLVASAAGNVVLYQRYQKTSASLALLENQSAVLASDMGTLKAKYQSSNDLLASISSPNTRMVEMKGVPTSPDSKAMIYWNTRSAEVYLSVASLPEAPSGMEYQLWAIVDGVPVDAGMISLEGESNMPHKMKNFEKAQAFAVTLEKKGGSPTPNLEAMVVIGTVES